MARVETIAEGVTLKRLRARDRTRRYRLRLKGIDVPLEPLGPKPGYRQTADHVEKRKRAGLAHYNWHGDQTTEKNGRKRALKLYPNAVPCIRRGAAKSERHHVDGNTSNNATANVEFLCRRCHMTADGRLARFIDGRS